MLLLRRLIRNKQNTVMTNSQIIEILKQEFDINVETCHELEVDIYIKIIKKYLKDWPQWEELERISSKLSSAKDYDAVTKVLNHKYKNLKEYLGVMLDAAKPLAKKAVTDIETDPAKVENIDSSDVVMEVFCTREQLNHLIFRRPRKDLNNTIFNIAKVEPTRISLNTLSFESVLNYWWTKVSIQLPHFLFSRELVYKYKHTLVNKVRDEKTPIEVLDTRIHNRSKKINYRANLLQYFDNILSLSKDKDDEHVIQLLTVILHVLRKDVEGAPDILTVPSSYRKFANKYKYVRYLYVENEDNKDPRYDLQLEEVISPCYQFWVGRLGKFPTEMPVFSIHDWLKIECVMCKVKFQGSTEMISVLQAHFNDYHQHEPDWQCQYCKRPFSMDFLAKNRWYHEC